MLLLAIELNSDTSLAISITPFLSIFLTTGTTRPLSVATAKPILKNFFKVSDFLSAFIEELKSGHTTKSDSVKMSNKDISVLVEIRNELKSILNELNRH